MNTVKIEKKNVKLIAHRGLSGLEAENTCSAFVAAGNRTHYGIETDIRRTADGKYTISHDIDLLRVAGEEFSVEAVSLSVTQGAVHFDKDGSRNRKDLISPTLQDYLSICKRYEKHAVIELKSFFTDAEISEIIDIINSFDYLPYVTFISFLYDNLLKVRKVLPQQSAQFLFGEITDEITELLIKDKIDVDVYYEALNAENIKLFHDAGLKVNCWTVDSKEIAENLISLGVDFITTNILE